MDAFGDLGRWLLENISAVGFTGAMLFVFYLLIDGKLVFGREAAAGKEALETLAEVNKELVEFRVIVAQQEIRDHYGKRDLDEANRRLDDCIHDLRQCRERRSS